ncbi:17163_t:CDS:2 [Funneliformis geosporum]|uniref:15249_t:CDS:1 n=1 Tax=Funneliformis geosporum TaxID=1117311 RepID=A0A9W4SAK8_9GLOM|nr:15249_t:CDS:2 [Funneliformis geosporum]CAI2162243.1 17163_t:CDS:2 [Funneliformis geosporum]
MPQISEGGVVDIRKVADIEKIETKGLELTENGIKLDGCLHVIDCISAGGMPREKNKDDLINVLEVHYCGRGVGKSRAGKYNEVYEQGELYIDMVNKKVIEEELYLGNDIEERIEQGTYNRFYGSLVALKDLTKLAKLQIEMTKVKENFEHLPNSNLQIAANRAALVTGGSLVLVGQSDTENPNSQIYTQIGGVISIANEFIADAEKFLDNYNELLGVLSQFEKIAELKGTDGEIDINELTEKRDELVKDLVKGKSSEVQGMIDAIKDLEKKIITYRKFSYYEENVKKQDKQQDPKVELEKENLLDEELEARIEIPINNNK